MVSLIVIGVDSLMTGTNTSELVIGVDSLMTGKNTSEFYFNLGSTIFSWSSKKQDIVAQSTAEAEFIATITAIN
jgi:hypothetical protein